MELLLTNRQAYVQKRHDILLDDTLKGYLEVSLHQRRTRWLTVQRRWSFQVDI